MPSTERTSPIDAENKIEHFLKSLGQFDGINRDQEIVSTIGERKNLPSLGGAIFIAIFAADKNSFKSVFDVCNDFKGSNTIRVASTSLESNGFLERDEDSFELKRRASKKGLKLLSVIYPWLLEKDYKHLLELRWRMDKEFPNMRNRPVELAACLFGGPKTTTEIRDLTASPSSKPTDVIKYVPVAIPTWDMERVGRKEVFRITDIGHKVLNYLMGELGEEFPWK